MIVTSELAIVSIKQRSQYTSTTFDMNEKYMKYPELGLGR